MKPKGRTTAREQGATNKATRSSRAPASPFVYFTVEAAICSERVDIFVPDVNMVQHATPLEVAFPVRLKYAQDFYLEDASHNVSFVLPFKMQFRMSKAHAAGSTNAQIKRQLQAEFNRLLPRLSRLRPDGVPIHDEILSRAKAVHIKAIARSEQPDEDYAELFS